jgi:hypothetical protein
VHIQGGGVTHTAVLHVANTSVLGSVRDAAMHIEESEQTGTCCSGRRNQELHMLCSDLAVMRVQSHVCILGAACVLTAASTVVHVVKHVSWCYSDLCVQLIIVMLLMARQLVFYTFICAQLQPELLVDCFLCITTYWRA